MLGEDSLLLPGCRVSSTMLVSGQYGVSHDIPAAAIGKTVIFEIVFSSDNFDSFQTGLVIDDFKVEGVEP